jgi:hypothetical protein
MTFVHLEAAQPWSTDWSTALDCYRIQAKFNVDSSTTMNHGCYIANCIWMIYTALHNTCAVAVTGMTESVLNSMFT